MPASKRLTAAIHERCLKHGDFTLRSGGRSRWYVDLRPLTLSAWLWNVVQELAPLCVPPGIDGGAIGGPCVGADPLVAGLLYRGHFPRGFLVRPETKGHGGDAGRVIGSVKEGDRCVVVEDVTTTGQSLLAACEAVQQERGAVVVLAVSVLDRGEGAAELFGGRGIPFRSLLTLAELVGEGATS